MKSNGGQELNLLLPSVVLTLSATYNGILVAVQQVRYGNVIRFVRSQTCINSPQLLCRQGSRALAQHHWCDEQSQIIDTTCLLPPINLLGIETAVLCVVCSKTGRYQAVRSMI